MRRTVNRYALRGLKLKNALNINSSPRGLCQPALARLCHLWLALNVIPTKVGIQCLEKSKVAGFRIEYGMTTRGQLSLVNLTMVAHIHQNNFFLCDYHG